MATRMGDANESPAEYYDRLELRPRRSTARYYSPDLAEQRFVFKAFTEDSLRSISQRRISRSKKQSQAQPPVELVGKLRVSQQADPCLAAGQQLPITLLRQLPSELIGRPIEDIDPYYADQEVSFAL